MCRALFTEIFCERYLNTSSYLECPPYEKPHHSTKDSLNHPAKRLPTLQRMTVHYVLKQTPYHPLACRSHSVSYSKVPTCCAIAKDLGASGTGQPNTKNQNKNHRTTRTKEPQEPGNHKNQRTTRTRGTRRAREPEN